MKTILEVVHLSHLYLEERGIESPRRTAEEVVSAALKMKRLDLYLDHERPLSEEELKECRTFLQRRGRFEPIQYIVGEVPFYDCHLKVTPAVFIPRPETEQLVDQIVGILKSRDLEGQVLWDICCGSGCIAIALKKHLPQLKVVMSDASATALTLARENAARNEVEVEALYGDLLTPFAGLQADFVVSNPPYIGTPELLSLQPEIRQFEPHSALFAGESGLEYYERFGAQLHPYVRPGGRVWFELGDHQAEAVTSLFKSPYWKNEIVSNDWSGMERFFSLEKVD